MIINLLNVPDLRLWCVHVLCAFYNVKGPYNFCQVILCWHHFT